MRVPLGVWSPADYESPKEFGRRVIENLRAAAAPRCSHVRRGARIPETNSFEGIHCERPAVLRILSSHGDGDGPVYQERCIGHSCQHLSPMVAATWDPTRGWVERAIDPRGWWR